MLVLIDVESKTDLVEVLCFAAGLSLPYKVAEEVPDFCSCGTAPKKRPRKKKDVAVKSEKSDSQCDEAIAVSQELDPELTTSASLEKFDDEDDMLDTESPSGKEAPVTLLRKIRKPTRVKVQPWQRRNCKMCGNSVCATRLDLLERHCASHSNILRFRCSQCDQRFKHPTHVRMHFKEHPGVDNKLVCDMSPEEQAVIDDLVKQCFPGGIVEFEFPPPEELGSMHDDSPVEAAEQQRVDAAKSTLGTIMREMTEEPVPMTLGEGGAGWAQGGCKPAATLPKLQADRLIVKRIRDAAYKSSRSPVGMSRGGSPMTSSSTITTSGITFTSIGHSPFTTTSAAPVVSPSSLRLIPCLYPVSTSPIALDPYAESELAAAESVATEMLCQMIELE